MPAIAAGHVYARAPAHGVNQRRESPLYKEAIAAGGYRGPGRWCKNYVCHPSLRQGAGVEYFRSDAGRETLRHAGPGRRAGTVIRSAGACIAQHNSPAAGNVEPGVYRQGLVRAIQAAAGLIMPQVKTVIQADFRARTALQKIKTSIHFLECAAWPIQARRKRPVVVARKGSGIGLKHAGARKTEF